MLEEVGVYTERKFRRWTFGRWCPPRSALAFRLYALDWIGSAIMIGCIACLVLALQWGGVKYSWHSGPVVAALTVFAVLVPCIVVWEWKFAGPSRILPLGYFRDRTQVCRPRSISRPSVLTLAIVQAGASLVAFFAMFILLTGTYYLPTFLYVCPSHAGLRTSPDARVIPTARQRGSTARSASVLALVRASFSQTDRSRPTGKAESTFCRSCSASSSVQGSLAASSPTGGTTGRSSSSARSFAASAAGSCTL